MSPHTPNAVRAGLRGYQALVGSGPAFTHQPLGDRIEPGGLAGYYCDFRDKAGWADRWGDGFPMRGADGPPADWAIPVAQTALGYWERHLDGEDVRVRFLRLADWLAQDAEQSSVGPVWRTDRPVAKYGLAPGWISALGQSQAISVLLRAHVLTGDERYVELARAALEPLTHDVAAGGLARTIDGHTVLEEYPTDRPCAVLNGWIFALLGVHELANATGEQRPRRIVDAGAASVVALLPRYDAGWWSLYSLYDHGRPDLCKPFYQRMHPVLLRALDIVRPNPVLERTASRWESELTKLATARVAVNKLGFRAYRGLGRGRTPPAA